MAKILFGITGSVAAIKTPELVDALLADNHSVQCVYTQAAKYFFQPENLPVPSFSDAQEWPNSHYERGDPVLHIELRRWADLFLIAPLDANTLAKLVHGICDNCLTCVYRAWNIQQPIVVAPAMNTQMWEHPLTSLQLQQLYQMGHVHIASPQVKELACGDIGMGAMADVNSIMGLIRTALNGR